MYDEGTEAKPGNHNTAPHTMTGSDFRNIARCAAQRLQEQRSVRTVQDSEFDVVVELYALAHAHYAREIAANGHTSL